MTMALEFPRYPIAAEARALSSPRLLVLRGAVEENIARMGRLLEERAPGSGFRHLRSHAKTCKSSWAVRLQMEAGITRFKATPNELDLLLAARARDIFVAYPPLPPLADRIARAIAADRVAPGPAGREPLRLLAQVSAVEHAEALARAAAACGVEIPYLIDLDVGMGRTGIAPEEVPGLLRVIGEGAGRQGGLRFAGLHAYDGHNRDRSADARAATADLAMGKVIACARTLREAGIPAPLLVAAGTPSFLPDLERLLASPGSADEIEVSPGTWIYWDSACDAIDPGRFVPAALLLGRVIDRPGRDRVTLDLGHKRWGIDSGPLEVFDVKGLRVVATSEEHAVLEAEGPALDLRIGDPVLAVPRHVCPTVNLWEAFTVIGPGGEIEIEACPVDGRNR
jgi:D-serine deaminase-like pyridoxal phosphate-dependent protein